MVAFSWFAPGSGPVPGSAADPLGRRPLEAVVFDWGGTLTPFHDVDLLDLWRMAALEISPEHADGITAVLSELEAAWWHGRDSADGLSGNGSEGGMTGSVTELLAAASARLGVDVAAAVLQAVSRRDLAAWTPHTMCDPEALLLVHLVRARGLLVGLLTNTRWPRLWHERLLERDGLLDLFHARVYTSDLPFDKPHPIAFEAVLDALGLVDPSRVLFVGDRVATDIRGARAAGMRTVLVRDGAGARAAGQGGSDGGAGGAGGGGPAGPRASVSPSGPRGAVHADAAHADAAHADAAHADAAHADAAHMDAAHMDAAHMDAVHMDAVHADAVIARLGQLLDVLDLFGAARPGTPPPR